MKKRIYMNCDDCVYKDNEEACEVCYVTDIYKKGSEENEQKE